MIQPDNTEGKKPIRLSVSYSRKFNLGNYQSEDIAAFTSWDAESDDTIAEQELVINSLRDLVNKFSPNE